MTPVLLFLVAAACAAAVALLLYAVEIILRNNHARRRETRDAQLVSELVSQGMNLAWAFLSRRRCSCAQMVVGPVSQVALEDRLFDLQCAMRGLEATLLAIAHKIGADAPSECGQAPMPGTPEATPPPAAPPAAADPLGAAA